jgi:DNA-binding CsgD family transcriptional regulator
MIEHQSGLSDMTETAINQLDFGIVILNQEGRIIHANRSAELLLSSGDGLTSLHGRLTSDSVSGDILASAVFNALGPTTSDTTGSEVCIQRKSGKRPYFLQVFPIRLEDIKYMFTTSIRLNGALVVITDMDNYNPPTENLLRTLFRLTATEASLAIQLHQGESIKNIASSLDLGEGTIRWHVKNIQSKTGLHRQSELTRLITRLEGKIKYS